MANFPLACGTVLALVLLLFTCLTKCSTVLLPPHRKKPLGGHYAMPPGPKGIPIFGSMQEWLSWDVNTFQLLQQANLVEMTTLCMGTKTWVLLNSGRVVNEILSKRASKTHERPYFPVAGELVSQNKRLFLQKTTASQEGRSMLRKLLLGAASKEQDRIVEEASLDLLRLYLNNLAKWYQHNFRFSRVTATSITSVNSGPIEFFSQISRLPVVTQFWRQHWETLGTFHRKVFLHWWENMRPLEENQARPSFLQDIIHTKYSEIKGEEEAMYLIILAISAGSGNPPKSARDEIEAVIGDANQLPTVSDLPKLPYMCAVVKEVLRWRPIVPLVPNRVLVEDLSFDGYYFPAGTDFLVNSIAVCTHIPTYPDPESFSPERWLKSTEDGGGIAQDLWQYTFSAGMRSCSGFKLAQKELFVSWARLLYCFNFVPVGECGDRELNAFSLGEPFQLQVRVRGERYSRLIRNVEA
ncbi:cytochrome P450 [Amniculicola lignicola CBS 123094]|uniref:Cytochrome P450 n=1 Tax=Amniculicola lignicola CBS 123094 TaxID=1392246 RepID=A0A6A5WRQ4_9PLEO|nr:cytochrome P450 [Amniculicola lignicola CBS 123094]